MAPRIYKSPYGELKEIPRGNAIERFFSLDMPRRKPDGTAFIDSVTGESNTFQETKDAVFRFAAVLQDEYSIKQNDVVCFSGLNGIWNQAIHMSTILVGAVLSPANIMYLPEELAHQFRVTQPKLVIAADFYLEVAKKAVEIAQVQTRVIPQSVIVEQIKAVIKNPRARTAQPAKVNGETQHAYYCFSSGTSGLPKGVISTHTNLIANAEQQLATDDPQFSEAHVVGAVLPMSHIYGLNLFLWTMPLIGNTQVTFPKFDLELVLKTISDRKVSLMFLVPPIILLLGKHPLVDKYPGAKESLRRVMSGAAPCSPSTMKLAEDRFSNLVIAQGYGLTETSPVTHMTGADPKKLYDQRGVGWLVPSCEARLVDPETGKDSELGQRGELWLRGPNIMAGYLKNPKATAETLTDDKWLMTGDVAVVHEDGQFQIVDRIKELIKSKGHQVAPAELETILISNPEVIDAAVIGVPDENGVTELPRAYIQLAPNANAEKIIKWFNQKVSRHKRLWGGAVVIAAVPKSPSGKILRRELRGRKGEKVIGEALAKL